MGSKAILYVLAYALALFAIFYFIVIIPNNKKRKKQQAMHDALKVGDTVSTIGGVIGTVSARDGDTVKILIDEATGTCMTVVIYAVQQVIK